MATSKLVSVKGKVLNSQAREIIYNVIKFMRDEAESNEVNIPLQNFRHFGPFYFLISGTKMNVYHWYQRKGTYIIVILSSLSILLYLSVGIPIKTEISLDSDQDKKEDTLENNKVIEEKQIDIIANKEENLKNIVLKKEINVDSDKIKDNLENDKVKEKPKLENKTVKKGENLDCYNIKTNEKLPEISEVEPKKGKSIFFLETSCHSYEKGKIVISSRQACAVESAAKMNPNSDVYLMYISPGVIKNEGDESDKFLESILKYENVKIVHADYKSYTKGTPVEALFNEGKIQNSNYVIHHSSDVLRLLTLWKYGGIYMDLDVVVLKSLEDLKQNFAGIESDEYVANGVLGFSPTGLGHEMVELCLNDVKNHYDGQAWSYNGPGVITRLLDTLCSAKSVPEVVNNNCGEFHLLPVKTFYPIPYYKWEMYFDENALESVTNITKDSHAIHIWNKLSSERPIPINSNPPYLYFARKYCPKIVEACDKEF